MKVFYQALVLATVLFTATFSAHAEDMGPLRTGVVGCSIGGAAGATAMIVDAARKKPSLRTAEGAVITAGLCLGGFNAGLMVGDAAAAEAPAENDLHQDIDE